MTGHLPRRPSWLCCRCGLRWPCPEGRVELLAEYDGASTQLAMYLAAQLYDAAQDLSGVEPGELWDRFLAWTRTSRLPRSCLGPGYR